MCIITQTGIQMCVIINNLFKYSSAHRVFTKWWVLSTARSLWASCALLLSPLVTHLTMWPTSECSCLPCDCRDATNNTHNEIGEEDRERQFERVGRRTRSDERAERREKMGHNPGWDKKNWKIAEDRDSREVNVVGGVPKHKTKVSDR